MTNGFRGLARLRQAVHGMPITLGGYDVIGCELEIERQDDGVTLTFNPESDDYVVEMSPEAFTSLAMAIDYASQQGEGYYGRFAFDVDNDDEE